MATARILSHNIHREHVSILTFQEMSSEEGVANLLVYGMCSIGIQSGLCPAKSEGRNHKADITLVEMVGVPEWVSTPFQSHVASLTSEYSCTNSTNRISHCEVSKSHRKPRTGFSIEDPSIHNYCLLPTFEIYGNYI